MDTSSKGDNMDKHASKIMAIAVVSLFCFSAFAVIVSCNDDSSAENKSYYLYLETINASAINTKSQWITFECDGTAADYVTKLTDAVKKYGYDNLSASYTDGDYLSFTYPDFNVGVWYEKDNVWTYTDKTAQQLPGSKGAALMLGGWISHATYDGLTDANKAKYNTEQGFSETWYAVKIPDVAYANAPAAVTHHIFLELFTDKGKLEDSKWVTFDSIKDPYTYATDATAAFKDAGWDKATLTYDGSWFSMAYTGSSLMNASAYVKDGAWEHVADTSVYLEDNAVCMAFGGSRRVRGRARSGREPRPGCVLLGRCRVPDAEDVPLQIRLGRQAAREGGRHQPHGRHLLS